MGQICTSKDNQEQNDDNQEKGQTDSSPSKIHSQFANHYHPSQLKLLKSTQQIIPFICKNKPEFSFQLLIDKSDDILSYQSALQNTPIGQIIDKAITQFKLNQNTKNFEMTELKTLFNQIDSQKSLYYVLDTVPFYFQSTKAEKEEIEVSIKTQMGKKWLFVCQIQETILDLKKKFYEKTKVDPDKQMIFYKGHKLIDSLTIQNQNVSNFSELFIIFKRQEKVNDLFQPNEILKDKETAQIEKTGPEYRKISYGLNLEGLCNNPECQAKGLRVVCRMQETVFDFLQDLSQAVCPLCSQPFKAEFYGLARCKYLITNLKYASLKNGALVIKRKIQQKFIYIGDTYRLFQIEKSDNQTTNYKILIDQNDWSRLKDLGQIKFCGICLQNLLDNKKNLQCGHSFHSQCLNSLQLTVKDCILC